MLWRPDLLAVNPDAKVTRVEVGPEKRQLVIVDDFYRHGEEVMRLAYGLYYTGGPVHGNFPGRRAMISLDQRPNVAAMSEWWGAPLRPFQGDDVPVLFSAIVTKDQRLNLGQRSPHIDPGVSAMVWLNPPEQCAGGTGIYFHVPTGLDRLPLQIDDQVRQVASDQGYTGPLETEADYTRFQDAVIFKPDYAAPENEYINDGNDHWRLSYTMQMKFNRLVIFDGRMPHSQHLRADQFDRYPRVNQILYLAQS